jgi:hypothetical protein
MTPTPEAREGEKELRSKVWQVMQMSDLYEFDSDYDEMLDAYRTAVRAALVAEMVESIVDERATDHLQMDYKIRLIKRITEAHPTETTDE